MRIGLYALLWCAIAYGMQAQEALHVYKGNHNSLRTNLTVYPGYTVYSLTQALGVSQSDFIANNPGSSTISLELNTTVSLRLNPSKIHTNHDALSTPIAVTYNVAEKETLYSIAKVYAQKEVEEIMLLNGKKDVNLSIGEELILGYIEWPYAQLAPELPLTGIEPPMAIASLATKDITALEASRPDILLETILIDGSSAVMDSTMNQEIPPSIQNTKGIAFCDRRGGGTEELVVMHPSAKFDSKIELYNPMLKRTVKATVVSSPPQNSYPDDISVVISPSVAEALGALDRRFLVEMTYIAAN